MFKLGTIQSLMMLRRAGALQTLTRIGKLSLGEMDSKRWTDGSRPSFNLASRLLSIAFTYGRQCMRVSDTMAFLVASAYLSAGTS